MTAFLLVIALFAQTTVNLPGAQWRSNPWDGTFTWGEDGEQNASMEAFKAQAAAIAKEHCGEQYFGSICK